MGGVEELALVLSILHQWPLHLFAPAINSPLGCAQLQVNASHAQPPNSPQRDVGRGQVADAEGHAVEGAHLKLGEDGPLA